MATHEDIHQAPHAGPRKKRRRKRSLAARLGVGGLQAALFASTALGILLFFGLGQSIEAPAWLSQKVSARASAGLGPDAELRFDSLQLILRRGWQPTARLRNVQVVSDLGVEIAAFSELEARLAMEPLLRGQVQPRSILLTGALATLRRETDGRVTLSGGQSLSGPSQQAGSLAQLVGEVDDILITPGLEFLTGVRVQALTLRYEDVRTGRAWTVDGGRMRLQRTGEDVQISADLALLSGGQGVATLAANYSSSIGTPTATFGVTFEDVDAGDIAAQGPAFAWLEVLRAPISGSMRGGVDADGMLEPLNATLSIGNGVVQPTDQTLPIPFDGARTYFTYDPQQESIDFAEISVDSRWIKTKAEGQAWLGGAEDGALDELTAQVRVNELSFNPADLYVAPIAFDAATLDFRLSLDPFQLELGEALVQDQGQAGILRGSLGADAEGWRYALDGSLDGLAPDRLMELWPERFIPRTREWVATNVDRGRLNQIDMALRAAPGARPDVYLSFDYSDVTARFLRNLPPVTGANGHATLLHDRFVLEVDDGIVTAPEGGPVDVGGTSFILPDVSIRERPPAVVRARSESSVNAALSLLDQPPLNVMQKAKRPVDIIDGTARMAGTLAFQLAPKLPPEEVQFDVAGTLENVQSDALVPGRTLSAQRMRVTADNGAVSVNGEGLLDGVPFDATWRQEIGPAATPGSVVEGLVELSPRALETFNVGLPDGSVAGQGSGAIRIDLPKDPASPASFVLESDLRGLTLTVPPIKWRKSSGTPGSLRVTGQLGQTPNVDVVSLDAAGLSARGGIELVEGGGFEAARFDTVQAGGWLNAPVTLVSRGPGQPPAVRIDAGVLDMRNAPFGDDAPSGSGAGPQASSPVTLALDRLQITDTIALTNMQGDFRTSAGLDGAFTGRVNGGAKVNGRVLPQNGRTAVRVLSEDAGGVLAASGLLRQARGGDMSLTLLPVPGAGSGVFDGKLVVRNTRIKDAPAMAALLSSLSIVGLLEQLAGAGITFSEVEADFRMTPDQIILTKGSAIGPSMGLSMDGTYNVATRGLDMRGVISPIYLLNGIGSIFTRKGEGVFGFNYRLRGTADDPKVSVNPLSALTPGMFREIFRGKPPAGAVQGPRATLPEGFAPAEPEEQASKRPKTFVDDR